MRSTNRRSVVNTSSLPEASSVARYLNLITRARSVMASSGSMDKEDSFLYPGIAAITEIGIGTAVGTPVSPGEGASETSVFLSLSFDLDVTTVRDANDSISWNTPSLRKTGLYSAGTLTRRSSTSCRAPITRVGWSFDDRMEEAKLATGTN